MLTSNKRLWEMFHQPQNFAQLTSIEQKTGWNISQCWVLNISTLPSNKLLVNYVGMFKPGLYTRKRPLVIYCDYSLMASWTHSTSHCPTLTIRAIRTVLWCLIWVWTPLTSWTALAAALIVSICVQVRAIKTRNIFCKSWCCTLSSLWTG